MQWRDRQAGARTDVDQTFPGQALDRLAHRRAAEAEHVDQRTFGGDGAGGEFEGHDEPFELVVGPCRSRFQFLSLHDRIS